MAKTDQENRHKTRAQICANNLRRVHESNALKNVYTKPNRVEQWPLQCAGSFPSPTASPTAAAVTPSACPSVRPSVCSSIRPALVQTIACVDLFENCVRTNVALTQHFPHFMVRARARAELWLGSAACYPTRPAGRQRYRRTDGQHGQSQSRSKLAVASAVSLSQPLSSYAPKAVQSPAAT